MFVILSSSAIATMPGIEQHFDVEDIDIGVQFKKADKSRGSEQLASSTMAAIFSFTDKRNGKKLPQLHPKVWLTLRRSEQVSAETSCEAKIKGFLSGQLANRADVDLNGYLVITLNQDNTVAFIDPQVAWSSGKLQGIVQLPSQGMDWALTKDGKRLYVTMPAVSAVAVIDTVEHALVTTLSTGAGSKPGRIVLSPDEQTVWVGLDHSNQVAVIDRSDSPKVNWIETGMGLHQLAFTPEGKLALITNTDANTVSIVDARGQKKLSDLNVGTTPLKAVWLSKAERFYVPPVNDSMLSIIDPYQQKIEATINVSRGSVEAAADPDGRYLWLVNQVEKKAYVIDAATNTTVAFVNLVDDPDQIAFTADYAYFRGIGSEKFVLVNRKQLAQLATEPEKQNFGLIELSATKIQAGEKPPSALPEAVNVAGMLAPVPDNNGVLVASAPSKTLYYYVEGMMVPMGTVDNYKRSPRALMILNRSLRETESGVFEAPVEISKTGNYDVAVLIDQPRITHCLTTNLEGGSLGGKVKQNEQAKVKPELLPLRTHPVANTKALLRFKLLDITSGKSISGIQDARLLAFEPPGLWQKREWLQEVENGIYRATVIFPHPGNFNLLVEANSKGLVFVDQAMSSIKIDGHIEHKTAINEIQ